MRHTVNNGYAAVHPSGTCKKNGIHQTFRKCRYLRLVDGPWATKQEAEQRRNLMLMPSAQVPGAASGDDQQEQYGDMSSLDNSSLEGSFDVLENEIKDEGLHKITPADTLELTK